MNIFKRKPPVTGGNAYETNERLNAQSLIDLSNLENIHSSLFGVSEILKKSPAEDYINERMLEVFWLLQLQANYFVNSIEFDCDDYKIREQIFIMIRLAFMNGQAGLYFDESLNKIYAVAIAKTNADFTGEALSYEVMPGALALTSQSIIDGDSQKLFQVKAENVALFKWGTLAIGAWILMLPFVKQQHSLLTMMTVNSFTFIKKYLYEVEDLSALPEELKNFFNPKHPFLLKLGIGSRKNLSNKIEPFQLDTGSASQRDFLDYYKESINIWYGLFGRRVNEDIKRERNITAEVDASQSQYDYIQAEYQKEFDLFIERAKEFGIGIERIKQEEKDIGEENEEVQNDVE